MEELDIQQALERQDLLMQKLGLTAKFFYEHDIIQAIQDFYNRIIIFKERVLPAGVYGTTRLSKNGEFYLVTINSVLPELKKKRTRLHELNHIALGDLEDLQGLGNKKENIICYMQRGDSNSLKEHEVELGCSIWSMNLVDENLDATWINFKNRLVGLG